MAAQGRNASVAIRKFAPARQLRSIPIGLNSGEMIFGRASNAFQEYFRLDAQRRLYDTRYTLVDRRRAALRSVVRPTASEFEARPPVRPGEPARPVIPERRRGASGMFSVF